MKTNSWLVLFASQLLVLAVSGHAQGRLDHSSVVTISSDGWELIGDLVVPEADHPVPAVLMLNQAAGDRTSYTELANALEVRGIASLRLDLRGHGGSINKGRFVPGEQPRSSMIWDAESDVIAAIHFLAEIDAVDADRFAVIGASYSGEEMAEAGRMRGYMAAYVALSPGSFSEESIRGIDLSGVPWLFVTSRDERFLQDIRAAVSAQSSAVEQVIVPGTGHATNLLLDQPDLAERIAVWLESRLEANQQAL